MIVSEYIKKEDVENIMLSSWGESALWKLRYLPPADVVEVRHGKWTIRATSYRDKFNYGCSVCHKRYLRGTGENFKYCPNCGAKMDGESE